MSDRPIIFSAPMVRALLAGTKTQTRRVLPKAHPRYPHHNQIRMDVLTYDPAKPEVWFWDGVHDSVGASHRIPYATGDRLWVREAFSNPPDRREVTYRADGTGEGRWSSPIHMPRWASRITLTVTEVRVQRLQEISEGDAEAEGCKARPFPGPWWQGYRDLMQAQALGETPPEWMVEPKPMPPTPWLDASAKDAFRALWLNLHGPDAWDANPWVVAVTFTVRQGNIDMCDGGADE